MKSFFCKILWVVYAFVLGQGIYEVYGWLCGTARGVFGTGNVTVGALVAIGGVLALLAVYILVVRVAERRWAVELAVPKIPKSLAMGWGVGVTDRLQGIEEAGFLGVKFMTMPIVFDFKEKTMYVRK